MALSSFSFRRLNASLQSLKRVFFRLCAVSFVVFSVAVQCRAQDSKANDRERVASYAGLRAIAPFVNKDTIFAARFDLERVDYEAFRKTLDSTFDQLLKNLQFEEEGIQACKSEFGQVEETTIENLKNILDDFREDTGLSSIFFIMQTSRGDGACFIAPAEGISSRQEEECKKIAEKYRLNCALYQQKYMVATKAPLKEFGAYYKDFQPSSNKSLESGLAQNADKIFAWHCGRLRIRPLFHATLDEGEKSARVRQYDPFASSPRPVKDLVEAFDTSFVEGNGFFDLSTLTVRNALKFTSNVNAGKFRDGLADVVDAYNAFYFKTLESDPRQINREEFAPGKFLAATRQEVAKRFNLYNIFKEYCAGSFKLLIPDQNGADLVFETNAIDEVAKLGPNTLGFFFLCLNSSSRDSKFNPQGMEDALVEIEDNGDAGASSSARETNPFLKVD